MSLPGLQTYLPPRLTLSLCDLLMAPEVDRFIIPLPCGQLLSIGIKIGSLVKISCVQKFANGRTNRKRDNTTPPPATKITTQNTDKVLKF